VLWLVLIYTLPAEPTRKRAFVWRQLKKLGAVYLRDGVCVVPDRPTTRAAMAASVDRIRLYEGQASLIQAAQLDDVTAQPTMRQADSARAAEYADLAASCRELLAHFQRESRHRDLPAVELRALAQDLRKLGRWSTEIRARDYFRCPASAEAETALADCTAALGQVMDAAAA
jgi:hypothetical protein